MACGSVGPQGLLSQPLSSARFDNLPYVEGKAGTEAWRDLIACCLHPLPFCPQASTGQYWNGCILSRLMKWTWAVTFQDPHDPYSVGPVPVFGMITNRQRNKNEKQTSIHGMDELVWESQDL